MSGEVPALDQGLHPLLRARWSPLGFDEGPVITREQVTLLLEAARWAPSAGNSQPWSFIVARRGDEAHGRIFKHLAASSAAWAPRASLLVVNLCHRFVEDTDWEYSEFSSYDLGQAVAHMTFQGLAMGLTARQFRAFDKDGLTREFALPAHWEVSTITAFGPIPQRDPGARDRRPPSDLLWPVGTGDVACSRTDADSLTVGVCGSVR